MKQFFSIALLGGVLMGVPLFSGCDKGDNVTDVKTVKQNPDGSTVTTVKKSDIDPKSGNGTTKIEQTVTGAPDVRP